MWRLSIVMESRFPTTTLGPPRVGRTRLVPRLDHLCACLVAWTFSLYFMQSLDQHKPGVLTFFLDFAACCRHNFSFVGSLATTAAGSDFCFTLLPFRFWDFHSPLILFTRDSLLSYIALFRQESSLNELHDLTTPQRDRLASLQQNQLYT